MNMVTKNEEVAYSGRLEHRCKRIVDHVGPSAMITATPTSLSVSSPSIAYASSSIATHGNFPPSTPSCIPSFLPLLRKPYLERMVNYFCGVNI